MKSKLEELIENLCPNGVEYKELGQVLKIKNGKDYKKYDIGEIPVYGSGGVIAYINTFVFEKASVLIPRKGSIDKLYYVDKPFWTVDTIFYTEIKENMVISKFVFYYLQKEHLEKYNTSGGVPSLTQSVLNKISIPVPPLEIQEEIVRILDKFTELTAELTTELTTELTLRKQQYEHYRDELLTFRDEVKKENLGILAEIKTGVKPEIILENNGKYEYINAGTANSGYTNNYNCEKDVVTTPSRGQGGIGFIGYQKNNFWLGPLCYKIKSYNSERVLNKYLYYYISKNRLDIFKIKNEGGVPAINKKDLEKITIKFPPLEEQKRIVEILDRFDKYINDIKEGLSAEIEMRQKQYEYYRDNLLDFKKLNVEG